jgi:hypothetical protein
MEIFNADATLDGGKSEGYIELFDEIGYARIYANTETTDKNYRDTILHEFVHLLIMWFDGKSGTHSKRFYRILNFLKEEFKC